MKSFFPDCATPIVRVGSSGRLGRKSELKMVKRDRKVAELTHLKNFIHQVLHGCRKDSIQQLTQICSLWNHAVGEVIAKNAQPAALKEKVLIVHVNSSPWIQQLQFLKREIVEKINQASEQEILEDIKFKIGPVG